MADSRQPAVPPPGREPDYGLAFVRLLIWILLFLAVAVFTQGGGIGWGLIFLAGSFVCWLITRPDLRARIRRALEEAVAEAEAEQAPAASVTIAELHQRARQFGGGAYLATGERGEWISAPPQSAVLVLAGPRAGKTSNVVIPALIAHPGAAVATSTKPEVLAATAAARRHLGEAWFFDLQGREIPDGCRALHWSPVQHAADWQQAQLVAEAMTGAADVDADHWHERAAALIACCLHAAALSGQGTRQLAGWVLRHDVDAPLAELAPDSIAADVLAGIKHTADRERSGIFSTAARVLRAYRSPVALAASEHPSFDPDAFVASRDTVYIAAAAHEQQLLAPLVVGLLTEIRQAAYRRAWAHGPASPPVLLMLDEAANIAPLPDLPAMLSEAGGQGLQAVVVLQDMSQARRRWPRDADGMLSLFGARVILSGIADTQTLEQLSLIAGDWDRPVQTVSRQQSGAGLLAGLLGGGAQPTRTSTGESWTTRRERVLPAGEIAQLPRGRALVMIGAHWQLLPTLPYDRHPGFAQLAAAPPRAPVGA
jgi:type IV secretion system protein VirD4